MKIVHVISGLGLGGAETSLLRLLRSHAGQVENLVISLRAGGEMVAAIEATGTPVLQVGAAGAAATLSNWLRAMRQTWKLEPQVVQGWMYAGNIAAVSLRALAARGAVLTWNVRASLDGLATFPRFTRGSIALSRTLSRAPRVTIYNSNAGLRQHVEYGFSAGNARMISNGVDLSRLRPRDGARDDLRRQWGVSPETLLVSHVARWDPMKDHRNLIEAMARLRDLNARLVLVGPGVTADNAALRSIIQTLKVEDRVMLLGARADVADIHTASDISCLCSYTEGLPNAVVEAMACGLPCVVTDVGDSARVVGDTGLVVPPRDPVALADALRGLLTESGDARRDRGRRARERVENEFTIERMSTHYLNLYRELTN